MRLHVLYRTHPGQNRKARPPYFSRTAALASLRRAVALADIEVTVSFVADGGLPGELVDAVAPGERVFEVSGGSAASSFRACVDVARGLVLDDGDDTLYWFAEDDYLYRRESMAELAAAASALPDVDYFTLYTADGSEWFDTHPSQPPREPLPLPGGPLRQAGSTWHAVRGTTSTFGVRSQALTEDAWLLRLGSLVGSPFDGATWHALQGLAPFSWRHLHRDLDPALSLRGIGKVVAKPVMRVVLNAATRRQAGGRRRTLVAPTSDLAMHMEEGLVPTDRGWPQVAAGTR